jgi:hypothetical protein
MKSITTSRSPTLNDLDALKDAGIISNLYQASRNLLRAALAFQSAATVLSKADRQCLAKINQALFIWGDRHEVSDGRLDSKLQGSQHLMRIVVRLLSSIIKNAYYRKRFESGKIVNSR